MLGRLPARLLLGLIRFYQLTFSAFMGRQCRFEPSCSSYASQAIARHGAARGVFLGVVRICRCGPGGGSGFDPVPEVWQNPLQCFRCR